VDPRLRRSALALLLVAGIAQAESRAPYGGKAVGSLTSAPIAVDPVNAQTWADVSLVGLLFDSLYRIDTEGHVQPDLALTMPIASADGLEARITVRGEATFHDGRPLGAADVVASLRRAQGTPQLAWALAPVKAITARDAAVILTLRRPVPAGELAALLALPQLAITEGGKAPNPRAPIGSGPFRWKRIDPATRRVELEAFPVHHAGRPYLDALVLRWFEDPESEASEYDAGKADLSLRGAVAFSSREPKYPTDVLDGPATLLVYLGFGRAHAELDADVEFRRAVSLAVNRAALRHVGTGERVIPALLPDAPDLGGATPTAAEVEAHVDSAAAALARVAQRRPELAAHAPIELIVDRSRPDDTDVASRLVAALDRAGLVIVATPLAPADYQRRVAEGRCDLYLGQLAAPSTERTHEYAAAFAAGGDAWAATRLADAPLLVESAAAAFAARLPVVPLYHRAVRVSHKKTILGLLFDPLGRIGLADAFVFSGGDVAEEPQP
jgi:MarR-like DNA-binding transcriptional regulator SgrR of sgrS sRNA